MFKPAQQKTELLEQEQTPATVRNLPIIPVNITRKVFKPEIDSYKQQIAELQEKVAELAGEAEKQNGIAKMLAKHANKLQVQNEQLQELCRALEQESYLLKQRAPKPTLRYAKIQHAFYQPAESKNVGVEALGVSRAIELNRYRASQRRLIDRLSGVETHTKADDTHVEDPELTSILNFLDKARQI